VSHGLVGNPTAAVEAGRLLRSSPALLAARWAEALQSTAAVIHCSVEPGAAAAGAAASLIVCTHLGAQCDTHNCGQLVCTGLHLLQGLHVLVEVQILCCTHDMVPPTGQTRKV